MAVALTDIKYGDPDGSVVFINAGDEVADIPDDVVDNLREQGAIGDSFSENDSLRIQQLQAELEDLRRKIAETKGEDPDDVDLSSLSAEDDSDVDTTNATLESETL
jgi:hypothetical protein